MLELKRVHSIINKLKSLNIDISATDLDVNKYVSLGRPHIAKFFKTRDM